MLPRHPADLVTAAIHFGQPFRVGIEGRLVGCQVARQFLERHEDHIDRPGKRLGRRVEPGSGERGLVAVGGFIPVGYYKDPEKSAKTFRTFEGQRWSVPGDFAEVNEDGTIRLLGRGSQVVNTGGEKVFPEEVEEALKTHPAVRDAVVVGVPDARFGERVCAVVDAREPLTLSELSAHVKERLAAYKAPRELVLAPVVRAANGKVDYKAIRAQALASLAQLAT